MEKKKSKPTMRIVGIRHKKGISPKIKDTQPLYYYICPFASVREGDYVLIEYQRKTERYRKSFFGVGRVDFIAEGSISEMIDTYRPTAYVLYRFPESLDFEGRCEDIKKARGNLMKRYEKIESNEARMRKLLRRQTIERNRRRKQKAGSK